jgi:ABC-type uncharacterized transport system auxiliary subunit
MPGWGTYQKRKKTQAELAAERRRELAKQFPATLEELIAIAAGCKKRPKKIPNVPPDDVTPDPDPAVTGPCQLHVARTRAYRVAKADGIAVKVDDEPVLSDRERMLAASRAYYQDHKAPLKAKRELKKAER